jgi:hypothetical protein
MDVIRHWFERMGSRKAETDTKGNRACLRLLHLCLALAFVRGPERLLLTPKNEGGCQ